MRPAVEIRLVQKEDNMCKLTWFGFNKQELETADMLIKDGYYSGLQDLHNTVVLINKIFGTEDNMCCERFHKCACENEQESKEVKEDER